MDELGREENSTETFSDDSPEMEIVEDDENCVETGRNLINSLLDDIEEPETSQSADDIEILETEEDDNGQKTKIGLQPASTDDCAQDSNPQESFEEESEALNVVGVNAVDLLEEQPEDPVPSTSYEVVKVEEDDDVKEGLIEEHNFVVNQGYGSNQMSGTQMPSTSFEDIVVQEKTLRMLTDLWIRENCVASRHSSMPREEIYRVYVDEMRNKLSSASVSREMFFLYLSDVFPSVRFRSANANGIRLTIPHRLAPSSMDWNMAPIIISDIDLLKGEAEGSPIERVTTLWVAQNCVEDLNASVPRQVLYATYINELRKKNRAFNGSIFLFESVLKTLFPAMEIRKTERMVFIKGVIFVGSHNDRSLNRNRQVQIRNRSVYEVPVQVTSRVVRVPSILVEIEPSVSVSSGTSTSESPPGLEATTSEENSEDVEDDQKNDCEPRFSGSTGNRRIGNSETSVDNSKQSSKCTVCSQVFVNASGLKVHMRKHTQNKSIQKRVPYTQNKNHVANKAHMVQAENELPIFSDVKMEEPLDFKEEPMDDYEDLPPLPTSMKPPPLYPYKCPVCCKGFRDPFKYALHMREYKNGEVAEGQDLGPNIYIDPDPTVKKKHRCGICNKAFAIFRDLTVHYRSHTGEKPYECTICEKKFSDKRRLKAHQRIHSDDKQFQCDQCDKAFNWAADLKLHYRNHNGDKPYVCDQCPKAFGTSGHLQRHKLVHTGEKRFTCEVCEKSFTQGYDLKNHMRTHTGERKYSCDHCQKSFARHDRCQAHMARHLENSSVSP